jgi:hypothetical protein
MGARKVPSLPPSARPASDPVSRQRKPVPPPAPPAKRAPVARVSIERGTCYVFSSNGMDACPLCKQAVPPNVHHECEKYGRVTTVRNRPE